MSALAPPVAEKQPRAFHLHGDAFVDDYHWLKKRSDPRVRAYLKAENAYARAVMAPTEDLRAKLYAEIKGRIRQSDLSVPVRDHGYWIYRRFETGRPYPILCRKREELSAPEEILLDLNVLAEGHEFLALHDYEVSDDGRKLAYAVDFTGFREYVLFVKDMESGELGPERIDKVKSFAWAADDRTLFYCLDDQAKRPYRLLRHRLGCAEDTEVFEETDESFSLFIYRSRDRRWLVLGSQSLTTSEARLLPADAPEGVWRLLAPRSQDQEYYVEPVGELLYILTNDEGRNFRVVYAPADEPGRERWQELLAHDPEIMRESFDVFRDRYVCFERQGGLPHLRVGHLESGESSRIALPESAYTVYAHENPEFDSPTFRYVYQSLTTPRSVYELELSSLSSSLLKQSEILGNFERSDYRSERIEAVGADGTRVPISLVWKNGARDRGPAPLLLLGYGAYGSALPVSFDPDRLSLLERGMIFAMAHVRGGGELGKLWHEQGRMEHKPNSFADFISVAEHLIREGYTSPDRLVIRGESAGGLLIGAVLNMRPDLFRAAVLEVPFVDVLNTMSNEELPLTVEEFEEWGNPKIEADYRVMRSYCPYTNLAPMDYPAMLVCTAFYDSQVMYFEPAKYVARLRALRTNEAPLIFHTNMAAGHGGASGRYERYREEAYVLAFILWQAGALAGEDHHD